MSDAIKDKHEFLVSWYLNFIAVYLFLCQDYLCEALGTCKPKQDPFIEFMSGYLKLCKNNKCEEVNNKNRRVMFLFFFFHFSDFNFLFFFFNFDHY